jgi:hypothetical protein
MPVALRAVAAIEVGITDPAELVTPQPKAKFELEMPGQIRAEWMAAPVKKAIEWFHAPGATASHVSPVPVALTTAPTWRPRSCIPAAREDAQGITIPRLPVNDALLVAVVRGLRL